MGEFSREVTAVADQFTVQETPVGVSPGATDVQLCQANPMRWGLIIALSATSTGATQQVNLSTLSGQAVHAGYSIMQGAPLKIDLRSHPALVGRAWFCDNPVAVNVEVVVFEEFVLQQGD